MEQRTKPEIFNGEKVGTFTLTAYDVSIIHEALLIMARDASNQDESRVKYASELRQKFKESHKQFNPS